MGAIKNKLQQNQQKKISLMYWLKICIQKTMHL